MTEESTRLEFLKAFLAERDVPCPLCGYNLRALTGAMCPECGSEVEVTVGLTEPRMAAFIAGVVGLAAGVGFNGFILTWWVWMMIQDRNRGMNHEPVVGLVVFMVLSGLGMYVWLRLRRQIRKMRAVPRWALAFACIALSIASAFVFFGAVR